MRARCSMRVHRGCLDWIATRRRWRSRVRRGTYGDRVELVHSDYRDCRVLDERGIDGVDGVLADLGVSSMQLDAGSRLQLPARRAARHADGHVSRADARPSCSRPSTNGRSPT
jgi:hypothetical protein